MAKYLAQIIVTGAQIVGRAFAKAIREELQASQTAARARTQNVSSASSAKSAAADSLTGITLQEAKQVLNIEDLTDTEKIEKNYTHLFGVNEKNKGGSFYIQSKVVRAKERIDEEIGQTTTKTSNETQSDTPS